MFVLPDLSSCQKMMFYILEETAKYTVSRVGDTHSKLTLLNLWQLFESLYI